MEVAQGNLTQVFDSAVMPVGTRFKQVSVTGETKEYIFLKGVALVVAKDVVIFDENFQAARLVPGAVGPVAVALSPVVANKWGWFQIYGNVSVNSDTTAADKALYADTVSGRVDDAAVTGDLILGMVSTAADTTNVLPVWLNYPMKLGILG